MKFNDLTSEEKDVVERKKTEIPFSGMYDDFYENGVYACKRCNAFLYNSERKFGSRCGWPSFDEEIPGAVRRTRDADGARTEIACERCDAHLGHVFEGEKFTEKNTRHCVNSISMIFIPQKDVQNMSGTIYFGEGCFWCTESVFGMIKGVTSVTPGYAGGMTKNPTYKEVSTGTTGHAEVVRVVYDPTEISLEALLAIFFASHDPTTLDRQGNDIGSQYRSVILTEDEMQKEVVQAYLMRLEREHVFSDTIVTQVIPLENFYEAEDYHKDYFHKNENAGYCQIVISPKVTELRKKFQNLIKEK